MTIRGCVGGYVMFPDRPEHEGVFGLVGGEDVQAQRSTFRSPTEAARWCEKVLAGEILGRFTPAGPIVGVHTPVTWTGAWITIDDSHGYPTKRWELIRGEWKETAL